LDAYLDLAVEVLRAERRPLSPKAILSAAYRLSNVPNHLHGKTQHKTLQARISEDIVERREHSLFFRTGPGRFFLREFLSDTSIPDEYRRPFPTRRRSRELVLGPALAIEASILKEIAKENTPIDPDAIFSLLKQNKHSYLDPRKEPRDMVFFRAFVSVHREHEILTYRVGRYRDDRDSFMLKRSIGFSTFINIDQHTLFNLDDFGITDSGIRAVKTDLDIPDVPSNRTDKASLGYFLWCSAHDGSTNLLAVIRFQCPIWFEPTKRRLALNDLQWLDSKTPPNDVNDFDPWSKMVMLSDYWKNTVSKERVWPGSSDLSIG
jgi:hypothetical protein